MDKNQTAITTYDKIADEYSKHYFDDLKDLPYIDRFLNRLPKNGKILDVGCGPGQFSKYMTDKGFVVTGVDFLNQMIEIAKTKAPAVEFRFMDMRKLEFDECSFDGLLSAYSLIHIPSDEIANTLNGFMKLLKSGGYLEIIVQKGRADRVVDEPLMPTEKMFINFFTIARLFGYLFAAGFNVIYSEEASLGDSESMSDKVIYAIAQKPE